MSDLQAIESGQAIDIEFPIKLQTTPEIYNDAAVGAERIKNVMGQKNINTGLILPHGTHSGEMLDRAETLNELGHYAGWFELSQRREPAVSKPIIFSEIRYKGVSALLIALSEQEVKKPDVSGKVVVYRYETPETLALVMKYGYFQAPLRGCLHKEVGPRDGWGANRVALAFDMNTEELNQGKFVYGLAFPKADQIGAVKLPQEVKQFLGQLDFAKPENQKYTRQSLTNEMRTQILLGYEALGTLVNIPPDRINMVETERANMVNNSQELFKESLKGL